MIIYGTGEKKLASQQTTKARCPQCGKQEITFHFFKKYAHLFWIPAFPIGSRQLAYCESCGASYQESIPASLRLDLENAKSRTSYPFYLFSGSALVVLAISLFIYLDDGVTTHYYPSKKIQAEGKYIGNKPEGKWLYYYESGGLQTEQYYRDGLEDSVWTWYDEEGRVQKTGSYYKGAFHGKWVFYYPSGVVQEEEMYVENRMQGQVTTYYENGNVTSRGDYVRGAPHGKWTFWYEGGGILREGEFDSGKMIGTWREYFPNGKPSYETLYKDTLVYAMAQWDSEGNQLVKNGNGTSVTYSDAGEKLSEGTVKSGLNDGVWTYWYNDGKLKEMGSYKDGVYSLVNSWDPGGQALVSNGNGYHKSYDDNGVVLAECMYRNGKPHGLHYTRNGEGLLMSEVNFVEGKMEGKAKQYGATGELYSEGDFRNNVQDGPWIWYHQNGQPESEVTFVNGQKQGDQIFYNESGEVVKREVYEAGKLVREMLEN
jgi:antitoxin component YwqK of YwqJK toxin-antitoxin module